MLLTDLFRPPRLELKGNEKNSCLKSDKTLALKTKNIVSLPFCNKINPSVLFPRGEQKKQGC
jgi:hypothetical protein